MSVRHMPRVEIVAAAPMRRRRRPRARPSKRPLRKSTVPSGCQMPPEGGPSPYWFLPGATKAHGGAAARARPSFN